MEQLMTTEELAELLHVDPVTVRRLVSKSELAAYRIGADYRFSPTDVQEYLQRQRLPARAAQGLATASNHPLDQLSQWLRRVIQGKQATTADLDGPLIGFTKRARQILTFAHEESVNLHHNYIGTEHFLLALVREEGGIAGKVLRSMGLELNQVRNSVREIAGSQEKVVAGPMPLTPRTKKVIELAVAEARKLNHRFLGTEHLLLGLLEEGEGIAVDILERQGLQLEQIRAETLKMLLENSPDEEIAERQKETGRREQGQTCPRCGNFCPEHFRYCSNCGKALSEGVQE